MCSVSAVHDYGLRLDPDIWSKPDIAPAWVDLIEQAKRFDKIARQPDCIDLEKEAMLKRIVDQIRPPVAPADVSPAKAPDDVIHALEAEIAKLVQEVELAKLATARLINVRDEARAEAARLTAALNDTHNKLRSEQFQRGLALAGRLKVEARYATLRRGLASLIEADRDPSIEEVARAAVKAADTSPKASPLPPGGLKLQPIRLGGEGGCGDSAGLLYGPRGYAP